MRDLESSDSQPVHLCPPPGMLTGGMSSIQDGLYSGMVGKNSHFIAIQTAREMTHGPHNGECFQLCHTVVSLCIDQRAAGICNWMAQSILTCLGQNSAQSTDACIFLQDERTFQNGICKHWRACYTLLQSHECFMAVLSSIEYLVCLRQDIQRMCDDCKMLYEPSIVGAQAEKLTSLTLLGAGNSATACTNLGLGFSSLGVSV